MDTQEDEFYTAFELAALLKVNVMTIYRYIKGGKLRAHKLGKEFRIARGDLESFLRQTATPQSE